MTDKKKPEDVVVNLFKDTNEHVMSLKLLDSYHQITLKN